MNEIRYSTAIHEAAHAVVSYVVGRRIMHVALFNDHDGEVMPECSVCDTCMNYYQEHNPAEDPHSRQIQDNLRCDMAIAMSGEIAQRDLCEDSSINESELQQDRERAKCRAAHIHRWTNVCWTQWGANCPFCENYIESMRLKVKQILVEPLIRDSIKELADDLGDLGDFERRAGCKIEKFLEAKGLNPGTRVGALPPVT